MFLLFSDNPQKCCKYAHRRKDESYLLRCKVIMGDVKVSTDFFVICSAIFVVSFLQNSLVHWSSVTSLYSLRGLHALS